MTKREVAVRFHALLKKAIEESGTELGGDPWVLADRLGIGGYLRREVGEDVTDGARAFRSLRNTIIKDGAADVARALTDTGVPHLFFKGAALIGDVYEVGDRDLEDVDVHVGALSRDEAISALKKCGYEPDPESDQAGPPELRATFSLSKPWGNTEVERVWVDVHWAVEPLSRLLPRATVLMPRVVWEMGQTVGGLRVPSPAHHAVLLMQHMAHHDFLHVRGLLDLALIWPAFMDDPTPGVALARDLGFTRPAILVSAWLNDVLDLPGPQQWSNQYSASHVKRFVANNSFSDLCIRRSSQSDDAFQMITIGRIRTRLQLLGLGGVPPLLADALFPPASFVRWRWPDLPSVMHGRARHLARVLRKLVLR